MITRVISVINEWNNALLEAEHVLLNGGIAAFPTETVYGLGAIYTDRDAVKKIFAAKRRPADNPLIVHVCSKEQAKNIAREWPELAALLSDAFWPGPISLIVPAGDTVPKEVTAGLDTVALRMPDNKFALELIRRVGPIAAPSSNSSGRPSPVNADHVFADMDGRIPLIIDGGECRCEYESTVVLCTGKIPVILRPGFITAEDITAVAGGCQVSAGVLEEVNSEALSPGMKYKHYAPMGEAILVAKTDEQIGDIIRLFDENPKHTVIICSDEMKGILGGRNAISCGNESDLGYGFFKALREADDKGYRRIIIEGAKADGKNLAFMNRALRACGFKTV